MEIIFDEEKLEHLLNNFFIITGIKFGIYDAEFKEVFTASKHREFCSFIQDTDYGLEKCVECDAEALYFARQKKETYIYRCHAGLLETATPIIESGEVIAYISFGQVLDDSPYDTQWEETLRKCKWYHDLDNLKKYFYSLDRVSNEKLKAYADITTACTSYIWLKRLIKNIQETEAQQLVSYIEQNYSKKICLDNIADALSVSKTKVCLIAQNQLGSTVGKLLTKKRIDTAKGLLESTSLPIAEIAEKIGISDYNYFSKVFKSTENLSPRDYRKLYDKYLD